MARNVREIMAKWLKEHGYDGLWDYDCGCKVDDLMPCEDGGPKCEPGYLAKCDCEGECDGERWHVQAGDVLGPEHPAVAATRAATCGR